MKTSLPLAVILVCFNVLDFVDSLRTCNPDVVRNIISRKDCPTQLLKTLSSSSPFTYYLNPSGAVPATVRCARGAVDHLRGGGADAHVTVEYEDTTKENLVINYKHEEVSPGRIRELDEKNLEYQIYVLINKPCFCYYRCTTYKTEGDDFAACAVPMATQNEKASKDCVQDCKKALKEVGITVELIDMTPCTN